MTREEISKSGTVETFMRGKNENARVHNTYIWFDIAMYEAQSVATFYSEHHLCCGRIVVGTRFMES